MTGIVIRRRQAGCWANKADPFRTIRGTIVERLPRDGRIVVEYQGGSGKTRRESCAVATVAAIDGHRTPWADGLGWDEQRNAQR